MASILRPSSDVNARGRRLRIYGPSRLQGLPHNRSTREDIIMFFQQIPGGIIRHADFHKYYPKHDGLSSSKRMQNFEALWKSCTIWLPQYEAYILNPACLPGKDATLSDECTSVNDILSLIG
ncbi:hypothetical protein B9Z19DRAFT_1089661 [Tuber borchii]|uniref:Uncharacterized protein n=1 Tax=Tuber borchii TaxID=42251 RepID=A0A2T6ZJZ6_TUBBO|nr:hypothetical protein B9Z19DRAFT_1089661 [Tuber borchii]